MVPNKEIQNLLQKKKDTGLENLPDIRHSRVRGSDLGIEDAGCAALG